MSGQAWHAGVLGVVEGLTEFIPVSSTGHLILAEQLFGRQDGPDSLLDVVIQAGAILAVCWVYRTKLLAVLAGLATREPSAVRFTRNVFLGILPSFVVGALAHDFIKTVLFSPWVVAWSLLLGGIAILIVEHRRKRTITAHHVEAIPPAIAFGIGLCQLLSLVPGVSRSGATIIGGIALGADRRSATEFSFFLSIPTMFAAAGYDLASGFARIDRSEMLSISIGLACSFIVAMVVIRWLLRFVAHHDFRGFAWYRIAAGLIAIGVLGMGWAG